MNRVKSISIISTLLLLIFSFQSIGQNWASLDAVVYNNKTDKYYFFFGKYCVIKERGKYIDGLPLLITEEWENFPASWKGGNIDAACYSSDNEKYYFFKGDEFCEKPQGEKMGKPMKLNDPKNGWGGIPWNRLDAAVYNSNTQTYYFFNGNEYVSKKRGEPLNTKIKKIDAPDGFVNLNPKRPIKDVDYSADNKEYYFFWDDFYMTKVQGEDIKKGTKPRRYEGDGPSGFEWAERSNDNFIGVANEGGYVANFYVKWKSGGKSDSWSQKGAAISYGKRLKLPKDATDITVSAYTYDLLTDDHDGDKIFKESMVAPPNKWYKVYGTAIKPDYKVDKKATDVIGDVTSFFNDKVGGAVEDAADFFTANFKSAQDAIVKEMAKNDFESKKDFILTFANDASQLVLDAEFIQSLYRLSKSKEPKIAADYMKQLIARSELQQTISKSLDFKTLSIGFSADASTVIGMAGSYGYGISLDGKMVKGYAGLDASLGVQGGLGLGCQLGIWNSLPNALDGNSVAVNVSVGDGVGVGISIVYNVSLDKNKVPQFSFAGIVVTPGVGVDVGASLSTGYSWVY
ncbi:MAG: hypothetical protein U0W24_10040 [Bacteroidales bacterium]